jgi:8-amino-7-oxononanoate synthase
MTSSRPDPLAWIPQQIEQLDQASLRRTRQARGGPQSATVVAAGRQLINFGSNDYLSLANDSRLADAVSEALQRYGWGSGASPLVTGYSELHEQLERELAAFEHAEAALLFTTGYAANLGAISALVGRDDAIYSDEQNHASIIDGCRLSRATVHVYRHCDASQLRELLEKSGSFRRRLIVTDSIFSMEGDAAPLPELAELAEHHNTMLMVDEAHATGVFGKTGSGWVEQSGVSARRIIRVGTFSKALGGIGGFVAGPAAVRELLLNTARSYIFSTAMPPAVCAAGLMALRIVREEPWRLQTLLSRAAHFRDRLREQGWDTGHGRSHIVPVIIGEPGRTMQFAFALRDLGFLVPGIRPPSVPRGRSLLRISVTAGHTEEMVDRLLTALGELRKPSRQKAFD